MADVSIVVETENLGGNLGELTPGLAALAEQIREARLGREALLVTDDVATAHRAARESGLDGAVSVRVLDSAGRGYYAMKDLGTVEAGGDIVVFLDSDTRPEPGWLRALVAPFEDPEVMLVGGTTSIGPVRNLYTQTMSLTGNFPVRGPGGLPHPHDRFWANNFAARRPFLLQHPFGEDGRRRGQCWSLGRRLLAEGVTIWSAPSAHVVHVPPKRDSLLLYAFETGQDMLQTERVDGRAVFGGWVVLSGYFAKQALRPLSASRRAVGLRATQMAPALILAVAYNLAAWTGATTSLLRANRTPVSD